MPFPEEEEDEELLPTPEVTADGAPDTAAVPDDGKCERDTTVPTPVLGGSQIRFAFAVIGSAAAVALASMFYGVALDWDPEQEHELARLACVFIARLLIIFSIRVSASLVAAIVNADPNDSALDASGAFLTWASAILTRVYYEAVRMTFTAVGIFKNEGSWDQELREFLSPAHGRDSDVEAEGLMAREERLSPWQRLTGGRVDRLLLIGDAVLYVVVEITTLVVALLQLMGYLTQSNGIQFSEGESGGQCSIQGSDAPCKLEITMRRAERRRAGQAVSDLVFASMCICVGGMCAMQIVLLGLLVVQGVYIVTQQQSLIPLLTLAASPPSPRRDLLAKLGRLLRWSVALVLLSWVGSLFVLPAFAARMEPFFLVGDIPLFWYVMIAPPSYSADNYKLAAAYAVITTLIGLFILFRLRADVRQKEAVGLGEEEEGGE